MAQVLLGKVYSRARRAPRKNRPHTEDTQGEKRFETSHWSICTAKFIQDFRAGKSKIALGGRGDWIDGFWRVGGLKCSGHPPPPHHTGGPRGRVITGLRDLKPPMDFSFDTTFSAYDGTIF